MFRTKQKVKTVNEIMRQVITTFEYVTPEDAQIMLERMHPRQRNVSSSVVKKYATDISNGYFIPTHQSIAILDTGEVFDGQHRLHSIVEAGVPVWVSVSRGWPESVMVKGQSVSIFDFIDQGRLRSISQVMQTFHGTKNANSVVALARKIAIAATGQPGLSVSANQVQKILDIYEGSIQAVVSDFNKSHRSVFYTFAAALIHKNQELLYNEYKESLVDGVRGTANHPIHALECWAKSHPSEVRGCSPKSLSITGSALYKLNEGDTAQKLYGGTRYYDWLLRLDYKRLNLVRFLFTHE